VRALVIGGGVGGLATALALRRIGLDSQVFEQAEVANRQHAGAGLSLWSNAMLVIRALGLEAEVLAAGSVIEKTEAVTASGRVLSETNIEAIARLAGAPSVCIHRGALYSILLDALPTGTVRNTARCVSFAVRGSTVIAHMSDGSVHSGDFLIGADGLHSAVRTQLLGAEEPRYAGYTCWRGIARGDWAANGKATLLMGSGAQAGLFPCGENQVYWFATYNAAPKAPVELRAHLSMYPEVIRLAIRATPPGAVMRNDIYDRPPVQTWGSGPVTLLGDAAHPSTPNLGQGACQALEDALTLAQCVAEQPAVPEALRAYERRRVPRTAMVTRESWRLGQLLQSENPVLTLVRNILTATPAGRLTASKLLKQLLCGSGF